MSSGSKYFCPIPWTLLNVSTEGKVRICPAAQASQSKGLLKDSSDRILDIQNQGLKKYFDNPLGNLTRKNMLSAQPTPEVCQRCYEDEEAGVYSRRQMEFDKEFLSLERAKEVTAEDGRITSEENLIKEVDLRLGNHCNLSCRMCSPQSSSGWYHEWYETRYKGFKGEDGRKQLEKVSGTVRLQDNSYKWYESDALLQFIKSQSTSVKTFHFSGGEPLLIAEHYRLLEYLVESNLSSDICLDYNTNLTVLPDRALKLWKNFGKVNLGVSVDGLKDVNDYIRFPSRFETIEENLHKISSFGSNIRFWITSTVQALNLEEIPRLIRWIFSEGPEGLNIWQDSRGIEMPIISLHMLRSPEIHSARVRSSERKKFARQAYLDLISDLPCLMEGKASNTEVERAAIEQAAKVLGGVVEFIETKDGSSLQSELISELEKSDRYRNQNYKSILKL